MNKEANQAVEAALQERIKGLVSEALVEAGKHERLSLSDIEGITLAARDKVGQMLAQTLVEQQGRVGVPGPRCEQCGREMHDKGRKKRRMVSRSGEVDWERPYYYCEGCRRGFFPPG